MNATRAIVFLGIVLIGGSFGAPAEDMPSTKNQPDRMQIEFLRNKAAEFYNRADFPSALEAITQALKAAEAVWGDSNTNVTEILDLTAGVYRTQGYHSNALALCKRSLAIRENALGLKHPDVATSLFTLASLYNDLGDYAQALEMGKRSLRIRENAFGREHQDVAASLGILSQIYVSQGDYFQALEANGQAFAYWDKHFETNPYLAVTCLNDMASINQDLGNYDSSLRLYQTVSALYEKLYGPDYPSLAAGWNNIASIYEEQGNYAEALGFYQRSLSLKLKTLGPEHPDVAIGLSNSAKILARLDKADEAMKLYQRALSILEKALGDTHPNVAVILNNIAELYEQQDDPSMALPLFERSLGINLKAFGNEHPRVASVLNNLASVCESQGKVSEALICYERSLFIKERALGSDHPEVVSILRNIAALWMGQNNLKAALEVYADAFRRRRSYLVLQFSGGTDNEALRRIERDHFSDEMFHSLCRSEAVGRKAPILGAEQLALNKGILEEVRVTQAALESDPETTRQELRQQRQVALTRLERLPKSQLEPKQQAETRREIEGEIKIIDEKLSERAPLAVLSLRDRNITTSEIARRLASESVLMDFVEFRRFDSTAKTNWWREQRYAVYLTFPLTNDSTNIVVERVDLGEAVPINEAVEQISKLMAAGQIAPKRLQPALQRLSDLVYPPLAKHLTNATHLIVCPDGQLSRVPFEMLPLAPFGPQARYLIEEKTVSYVTSGREVVRLASPKSDVQSSKSLVMGNPDFDFDLGSARAARAVADASSATLPSDRGSRREEALANAEGGVRNVEFDQSRLTSAATRTLSRDYRGLKFTPLPGSEQEAKSVATLLGGDCLLRLGKDAREAELKAVVSPRVLHLATHGFFLSDQEFKSTNALASMARSSAFTRPGPPKGGTPNDWENPMVRCGIALAGANRATNLMGRSSRREEALSKAEGGKRGAEFSQGLLTSAATRLEEEDGLLTGLEASQLNLQGTELVILSACESGAGEVKIGEGVMSLRRAFRIAGAETVLASHWKVSDKATSQLMTEFMRRWRAGEPRAQAWREAQLALLRSKDFSSPYFWAAFTLTGQWR